MRRFALCGAACTAFAALACGGGAQNLSGVFDTGWRDDQGRSIAALQAKLASHVAPVGPALALGVTRTGLAAIGLDGNHRWTHATRLDARPALAGDVVVATGGGRLFALDAETGRLLWSVSSEGRALRGAGDDGRFTVATLGVPRAGRSLFVAVDREGRELVHVATHQQLGEPAVLAGIAFVPWGTEYVSAIDVSTGDGVARLLVHDRVSRARAIDGALYFGEQVLVRFDDRIGRAYANDADRFVLPALALPGAPVWFSDGDDVVPRSAAAQDSVRAYALPRMSGAATGFDSNRFAATYFRVAMGFDTTSGALAWVTTMPTAALGGTAAPGGFVFCSRNGGVHLVSAAQGGDAGQLSLDARLESCVVQAGAWRVPASKPPASLPEQIARAVKLPDAQMVPVQRFLLTELAKQKEPLVTKLLIDLAQDQKTPPALVDDARRLLATRRNGADYMLAALKRHYNFLSDVLRPPPVGPLADALGAMGEARAAPLLASHLNDPADTPDDVEHAARALDKLATPAEYPELKTFFSLYRSTANQKPMVEAVIAVARALVRIGGEDGRSLVESAAHDPLTEPDVREGLQAIVPGTQTG
jgi:outer membrane protein assembly factor BamB